MPPVGLAVAYHVSTAKEACVTTRFSASPARLVEPSLQQPRFPRKAILSSKAAWKDKDPGSLRHVDTAAIDIAPIGAIAGPQRCISNHLADAQSTSQVATAGKPPAAMPATSRNTGGSGNDNGQVTVSTTAPINESPPDAEAAEMRLALLSSEGRVQWEIQHASMLEEMRKERELRQSCFEKMSVDLEMLRAEVSTEICNCMDACGNLAMEIQQDQSAREAVNTEIEDVLREVRQFREDRRKQPETSQEDILGKISALAESMKMKSRMFVDLRSDVQACVADVSELKTNVPNIIGNSIVPAEQVQAHIALLREELLSKFREAEERNASVLKTSTELVQGFGQALEAEKKTRTDSLADMRASITEATELLHGRVDVVSSRGERSFNAPLEETSRETSMDDVWRSMIADTHCAIEASDLKHGEEFQKCSEFCEKMAARLKELEYKTQVVPPTPPTNCSNTDTEITLLIENAVNERLREHQFLREDADATGGKNGHCKDNQAKNSAEEQVKELELRLVKRHENLVQTLNKDIGRLEIRFESELASSPGAVASITPAEFPTAISTRAANLDSKLEDQRQGLSADIQEIGAFAFAEVAALRGDTDRKIIAIKAELDKEVKERQYECSNIGEGLAAILKEIGRSSNDVSDFSATRS